MFVVLFCRLSSIRLESFREKERCSPEHPLWNSPPRHTPFSLLLTLFCLVSRHHNRKENKKKTVGPPKKDEKSSGRNKLPSQPLLPSLLRFVNSLPSGNLSHLLPRVDLNRQYTPSICPPQGPLRTQLTPPRQRTGAQTLGGQSRRSQTPSTHPHICPSPARTNRMSHLPTGESNKPANTTTLP